MNDALGMPQKVLVLGGGSEIARALLRRLVPARAKTVALAGRPASASVKSTAEEMRALGADVDIIAMDAEQPSTVAVFAWRRASAYSKTCTPASRSSG